MQTLTFRSRIDAWLAIVMLGVPAIVLASVVPTLPRGGAATAMVVGLLALALPLWVLTSTRYDLSADTLRIVSGPFRWKVPIAGITSVVRTRSAFSSPALSLQRLQLRYGDGRSIMISPTDEPAFLRALEERRAALQSSR